MSGSLILCVVLGLVVLLFFYYMFSGSNKVFDISSLQKNNNLNNMVGVPFSPTHEDSHMMAEKFDMLEKDDDVIHIRSSKPKKYELRKNNVTLVLDRPVHQASFQIEGKMDDLIIELYNDMDRKFLTAKRSGNSILLSTYGPELESRDIFNSSTDRKLLNMYFDSNMVLINRTAMIDYDVHTLRTIKLSSSRSIHNVIFSEFDKEKESDYHPSHAYMDN